MQWLVDLVYAMVLEKGFYFDRGDPTAYDFKVTDLFCDDTWRNLDLSAIVPANAKAVALVVRLEDNLVGKRIRFRKKGNTDVYNDSEVRTQVANIPMPADVIVAVDTDRKIQYRTDNTSFTRIDIVIKGWWK